MLPAVPTSPGVLPGLCVQSARMKPALPPPAAARRRVAAAADSLLIAGAGGVLGAALLAQALGSGRFAQVQALAARPLASTLPGFEALPQDRLDAGALAHTAAIVLERERHHNGRDQAYVQPRPDGLPDLAQRMFDGGVRRLLVVVPHAPALLPQALMSGLASVDEGRVAALGYEQLLFLRAAQGGPGAVAVPPTSWPAKVALWWLAQLSWMVPQAQLPVRSQRVAELVTELAWRLGHAPAATRVLPPDLLWQAAQSANGGALLDDWLHGRPLPPPQAVPRRW